MSKTRDEIKKYSEKEDVECLLWLLTNYRMSSEFNFVARCEFKLHGRIYQRHWAPTTKGRLLFKHREEL